MTNLHQRIVVINLVDVKAQLYSHIINRLLKKLKNPTRSREGLVSSPLGEVVRGSSRRYGQSDDGDFLHEAHDEIRNNKDRRADERHTP